MVQRVGQVHLVAGRTELGALVQRFQQRLLVERGPRLDELAVDRTQQGILAECKRIAWRIYQTVIGVAARAVDTGDGVAGRAGDARAGQRVVRIAAADPREKRSRDENGKPLMYAGTWPNTGIGRLNLDGSRGSCSACSPAT